MPFGKFKERVITPAPRMAWLWVMGELFMAVNVWVLMILTACGVTLAFCLYWVLVMGAFGFFFVPVILAALVVRITRQ